MVWLDAMTLLCLWHVSKAYTKNVMKEINAVLERTTMLQMLGDIMYGKKCGVDEVLIN